MLRFGVHEEQPVFRGKLFGLSTKKKTRGAGGTNIFSAAKKRACLCRRNVVKFTVARSKQCQEKISLAKTRPSAVVPLRLLFAGKLQSPAFVFVLR